MNGPHPELANEFINFILDPKIGAELSNYNDYATPNQACVRYLVAERKKPPLLPGESTMQRLHFTPALKGEKLQLSNHLWESVQAK